MQEQNLNKHSKYVPGFHGLTFGIVLAALIVAVVMLISSGISMGTSFAVLAAIALGLLFFYTRHFATGNQDRIIRAEENFRSYRLTGKALDNRLTRTQIIALRFADDGEFSTLAQQAADRNMNAAEIKQAIQTWRADHHRV